MKWLFSVFAVSYLAFLTHVLAGDSHERGKFFPESFNSIRRAKSCLDFLREGVAECGYYQIFDDEGMRHTVYCDFNSEPGSAWTLVMSHTKDRRFMPQFRLFLLVSFPVNEKTANWQAYRMSWAMMTNTASQSTHWRYTCSFPQYGVDYTDYARAEFTALNPLTFEADGACARMEYINIRGNTCAQCKAQWWQPRPNKRILHMDSYKNRCEFKVQKGAIKWEDNFGYYDKTNPKFRCTANNAATTNLWFGGYL